MKHGGTMSSGEYLSALKLSNGSVQQVECLNGLPGAGSEAELGQQSSLASQPARSTRHSEFAGNQTSNKIAAMTRRKHFTRPQNTGVESDFQTLITAPLRTLREPHAFDDRRGTQSMCSLRLYSSRSRFALPGGLCNGDFEFQNQRLSVWNERMLIPGQGSEKRQFHSLDSRLDASKSMSANRNLVSSEDQAKFLFLPIIREFCKQELVERQEQRVICRNFNA